MVLNEKIAERIKSARKNKGFQAKELAKSLNMSVQIVSQWENGKRIPPLETAKLLSEKLGVSVGYLYCIDESNNKIDVVQVKLSDTIDPDPFDSKKSIPVPSFMLEEGTKYLAIRIADDSMGDVFRKNDIVLINTQKNPHHNGYVLAKIRTTGQVIFRRYVIDSSNLKSPLVNLVALNDRFDTIQFDPSFVSIIGVCSDNHRVIA
jgi:transcriptional regulator with XRE-family HTH domain